MNDKNRQPDIKSIPLKKHRIQIHGKLESQILANITEGVYLANTTGEILYTNTALEEMFGYQNGEMNGKHASIMYAATEKSPLESSQQIFYELGKKGLWEGEIQNIKKNGTPFWCNTRITALEHSGYGTIWIAICQDITQLKNLEEERYLLVKLENESKIEVEYAMNRFSFIAEASALLSESLEISKTLENVAKFSVPRIADWCAVDLLKEDGTLERVAVVHSDPSKIELAYEIQRKYPEDPGDPNSVAKIIQRGEPFALWEIPNELISKGARDEEHLKMILELGLKSAIVVPMIYQKKKLGVITLVYAESDRRYNPTDLDMVKELATRAAIAIENSNLYSNTVILNKELVVREAKFRGIFDSDMVGILFWDSAGNIEDVNGAFLEIVGYSREEVIEGNVRWVSGTQSKNFILETMDLKFSAKKGVCTPFEEEVIRKDGRHVPVFVGAATLDGANDQGVAFVLDISDRKNAEKALYDSETRYRKTLNNMMEGCQILDYQWRYLYLNDVAASQGHRPKEELLNHSILEMYPGIEETEMFSALKRCMETRVPEQIENEFIYSNGVKSWFDLRIEPAPEGIFILSMDITERKKAEEEVNRLNLELEQKVIERTAQLEAANKEMEAFSYSVSHDLRAPLRSIDGFSQALMEDYPDRLGDEGKYYLERLRSNTQRMGQLIDDMLHLSRVTRADMHFEPVNLSALAESVVRSLKTEEPDRKVDIIIQSGLHTEGDSNLLGIALTNLFSNAWKFTKLRERARIELGSQNVCDQLAFYIRDNGVGFDMAYADKLFGAFQRLHTEKEFPGTGIGLATVQRIIRRHNGAVWAESAVNQGATFFFAFPPRQN